MRCWTPEDIAEQEAGEMGVPPPAPSASTMITPPVPMPTFPVPMPTFPAMTGAIDPNNCAGEGGRAQQCGASANRPPMCCEGFVCTPGNAKVSSVVAFCCHCSSEMYHSRNRVKYFLQYCVFDRSLISSVTTRFHHSPTYCTGYLHGCLECSCGRRRTGGITNLRWRWRACHGVWCRRRSTTSVLPGL